MTAHRRPFQLHQGHQLTKATRCLHAFGLPGEERVLNTEAPHREREATNDLTATMN